MPPIPARPRPASTRTSWQRVREALWGSPLRALLSLLLVVALGLLADAAWRWAFWHAVWQADEAACQAARGVGACWGVVVEKHRAILFGRYPFDQQWRAAIATVLLLALLVASGLRRCWRPALLGAWVLGAALCGVLMAGGVAGLAPVRSDQWGGLPLTVLLATAAIVCALPLGVLLALGRRSALPALRGLCTVAIELLRGVPLVSVLFMASFMLPLLLPPGRHPDVLLRVWFAITLFAAAYLAEIVRAGLQSLPTGQAEAAAALGLGRWATLRRVLLPQALAAVVPALVNSFIGIFKDTSLITVVSLYELTGALDLALGGDADWRPYKVEGYVFICAVYFVACWGLSRYSRWLEARWARSQAR
jgi:general L-amino acid transport system permease protein